MTGHDDALSDSIAVLALGALPPAEAKPLAEHIASCERCRLEYAQYRTTSDLIGYAAELEPGALDEVRAARLKSRVMHAVREDVAAAPRTAPAATGAPRSWFGYAAAAAAIVVALLTSLNNATLRSQNDRNASRFAALEAQTFAQNRCTAAARLAARDVKAKLAKVIAPGSKHFGVPGGEVIASGGRIIIALRYGPPLPAGKVYQAWTLAKDKKSAKDVVPSITFMPDADGVAVVELPEPAANLGAVALTVEPAGGSKAPTSKPAFVRPLL